MQKIETKAGVILLSCELIPFELICMCYDKYNGIGDTFFGACFGDKRSKYHQNHTVKYPKKKTKNKINNYDCNNETKQRYMNTHLYMEIDK